MFKVKSTLDINNKNNKNKYIFYPRNILSKTLKKSISGISINSNINLNNNYNSENKYLDENSKNENTFYKLNKIPPVYFYRKIQSPYKYNISSVPEYLIKTNEEKHFMEKINKLITNETEKKNLNNLINKKEDNKRYKDRYKPSLLDISNILKYKPNLYFNSLNLEKRSKSVINNNNNNNNKIIEEKENDEINIYNNIKKKDEISKEDQIKYKYKISDIYNLRNEKVITDKSAERYLFKNQVNKNINQNNNNFNTSSQSKSDWIPNRTIGTKMNSFSSVSYNILSPLYKGLNKFISSSELNKNNLYNESTAFHRVKSISEFIDLTRVSASNSLNFFNMNKKNKIPNFKFNNNVGTDHLDAYHINRDLIEKPL